MAAQASVRLSGLAAEPLVLINLPHSREYFLSLFRDAGVAPTIAWEASIAGDGARAVFSARD